MIKTSYYAFDGGENLVSPAITMKAGELHKSLNYETSSGGGYRRISGFERFDGQQSPFELAKSDYENLDLWKAAMEAARSAILPIPGSGPVRGVWSYKGDTYGFRDNVAETQCGMYRATSSGWSLVTEMFPAGGFYEFINYNFYGSSDLEEMYGINGVGQAFKFDGTTATFISTTMTEDVPTHIAAHKYHLFLSFAGGSIQHSSMGNPTTWSPITGASEIAIGQECSGFTNAPNNVLAIFGRNSTYLLYGTNVLDWNLTQYSQDSGAIPKTIKSIGVPIFLDDRGIKTMTATNDFGDFSMYTLTAQVKPLLDSYRGEVLFAMRVRNKDQYRLFFSDGVFLIITMIGSKVKGITRGNYGKTMTCGSSSEDSDGEEILFAGDENGYVYSLDKGNCFDGEEVYAYIRPAFYHFGTPENLKRFSKMVLEIEATETMEMSFVAEFSYGSTFFPSAQEQEIVLDAGAGYWDSSYWEAFYWDSQSISTAYGYLTGIGKNFRIFIKSIGLYEEPHTIQGAIIHYSLKGRTR